VKQPVFIDTSYILALLNTADRYHERAAAVAQHLQTTYLTTEAVLTEIGNALSRIRWRSLAVETLADLRTDPDIEIVPVNAALFDRAVVLFASRRDKEWGLTDCISFVVMQERNLRHALTTDAHFVQAGYQSLLDAT
jgi:predicted nucleic acid-binding protein